MATNKMLIDATHPEETRVVVVRGNRVEEFDFEAQERKQLRGNIYLAKVTRVEPSLQAAFVDYGGNRHGFLAFSEIHPDYYQIPAADRQALLAEEEAAATAAALAEEERALADSDEPMDAAVSDDDDDGEDEAPARKKRRRSRRRPAKTAKSEEASDDEAAVADDVGEEKHADADSEETPAADDDASEEAESADAEEKPKRKRRAPAKKAATEKKSATKKPRTRRTKKADGEAAETADNDEAASTDDGDATTMASMMAMDSISEMLPDEDADASEDDDRGDDGAASDTEEETAEKPEKKTRTRKRRTTKAKKADKAADAEEPVAASDAEAGDDDDADEAAEARKASGDSQDATDSDGGDAADDAEDEAAEEKPARRARRSRKRKAKKADSENESDDAENGDSDGEQVQPAATDVHEEVEIRRPRRQYKIQEVVRRRQVMLVQVVKEERGNKGAALTTYLSLAGRYSVLMPNTARGGGISRKITNPSDRKRLKTIAQSLDVPKGMGVILRTAGASQEPEEIQRDFDYLMRLWDNVRNLTLASSAPFLVYEEGSLIKRSIRDLYNKEISEIIVAGDDGYKEARDFMQMLMPESVKNVKRHTEDQPLFSRYGVESQLEKLVSQQVTLKSGGYLIINQTEALVAIDVNSGKSTREHSIEATALQTNLEAAEEVARQLRLRDLAGLVVIDFIDMEEKRNNRAVERKLKDCLKSDRARIQVGHISHFGLLEMSRQRIRASVLESTMAVCPACNGVGHVRSQSSQALMVLRALEEHLMKNNRNDAVLTVSPAMALYILNHKRQALMDLEQRYKLNILIQSGHDTGEHEHRIERGEASSGESPYAGAVSMASTAPASEDDAEVDGEKAARPADDEEENGNRRGRKRRGRGRGRNREDRDDRDDDRSGERHSRSAADQDDERTSDEEPAMRGRAKARKGVEKDEASRSTKANGETVISDAKQETGDASDGEPARTRPERRTGRPGKKVRAADDSDQAETVSEEANADLEARKRDGAPPREVKRRNTRRVRKSQQDDADDAPAAANGDAQSDAQNGETDQGSPASKGESADTVDPDANDEGKSGWSGFLS